MFHGFPRDSRFSSKPRFARTPRFRQLRIEALEQRNLLASIIVTNLNGSGAGSLRAAIDQANLQTGPDTIEFSSSLSPGTISLTPLNGGALPAITDPLVITAANHPSFTGGPLFTINGSALGSGSGFSFNFNAGTSFANNALQGLRITAFPDDGVKVTELPDNHSFVILDSKVDGNGTSLTTVGAGIRIAGSGGGPVFSGFRIENNTIVRNDIGIYIDADAHFQVRDNRIGTDGQSGNDGNASTGVFITNATPRGFSIIDSNTISGNTGDGIQVQNTNPTTTTDTVNIFGNKVGTDVGATIKIPNSLDGIRIVNSAVLIDANVISGNSGNGVTLSNTGNSALQNELPVRFNKIGTNSSESSGLANGGAGIAIESGADDSLIEGNWIAGNTGDGISLKPTAGVGHQMTQNKIWANGGTAIDLNDNGPTPNDPAGSNDSDTGANTLINFPVVQMPVLSGSTWTVTGTLDTDAANHAATIELYKFTPGTNRYEYIKSLSTTPGTLTSTGDWPGGQWSTTIARGSAANQLLEGDQLVALLIDTQNGNTSELSFPSVVAPSDIVVNSFTVDPVDPHYLNVNYTVNGPNVPAFRIGVYRSTGTQPVLDVAGISTVGTRTAQILVDSDFEAAADAQENDYTLIAKIDYAGAVQEASEMNNDLSFAGGTFQAPMGTLQVHGGTGATTVDMLTVAPNGSMLDVTLDGNMKSFAAAGVPAIHVRTHGGNDEVTRGAVDAVMSIWGGDGDDKLTIDGVAVMPTSVSKFDPGAGSNTFTVNNNKVYLNTTPNGVGNALAGLTTTVKGGAELQTDRLWQTILTIIENSKVKLTADGSFDNPACKLNTLAIEDGSTLDINDQALIIDYTGESPLLRTRQLLISGRGGTGLGKPWNGTGITSSAAELYNQSHANGRSVGYAENALLPLGAYIEFRHVAVDNTCVLIAYTATGDANLTGVVDDDDVTIIGTFYAPGVSKPEWAKGDLDYNGFVDDDDVTLLGSYYNPAAPPV